MYIRRAVLPASPEGDAAPSSNFALLPLLSLSVLALILVFFIVRFVKRGLHFPNLAWLRGKSKRSKGSLGLYGVELLPTSFKSTPASSPSPFSAAFNLEGNAGKSGNSTLLSRSSSLDALPQLSTSSPHLTSRKHADWRAPFSLPAFLKTKNKPFHRRSRSLNISHRPTFLSMSTSAPSSPKTLLVDISTSESSPTSASSDLGTHKLHPASPLIPGLSIPTPVKIKPIPKDGTQIWTSDVEDESHDIADSHVTDELLSAFKRPQQAKPPADTMPLIQDDQPFSSPSLTPPLVPKRLSTSNPFASLVDSFTSQTFISDRPAASSSLPLTPSSPPGIELVSIKPIAIHSTLNLLDLSNDDAGAGCGPLNVTTGSTRRVIESFITRDEDMASTHVICMETAIDLADPVSDPFDDSHAITYPVGFSDDRNSESALSLAEELQILPTELAHPIQPLEPLPVAAISVPASPHLLPSPVERVEVEKALPAEPEELTSSWQRNGSWNPPSFSVSHFTPEFDASLGEAKVKYTNLVDLEAGDDLMSFVHEEAVSVDEQVGQRRLDSVDKPGIDVTKEEDPADTWFVEEPTAVWDVSWTDKNVKEGLLLEKGIEDDETKMPQEAHINVLDELLVGPSEPIDIHIFGEIGGIPVSERPFSENSEVSPVTTSSNDNHDIIETITPYSTIPTPIILAATPLPSTPDTPLPGLTSLVLPSLVLVPSSPIVEECPNPDVMPLLDLSPSFVTTTPVSPVPVKLQPPSVLQAQTPTPPASPPPSSIITAKPSSSLRDADTPSLGLRTSAGNPSVPEVRSQKEAKPTADLGRTTNDAERVIVVVKEGTVVEGLIERATDQSARERSSSSMLQSELSSSIPCSFPGSPSEPSAVLSAHVAPAPATAADSLSAKIPQARTGTVVPSLDRVRTPRSVIDIALAMQLRPGLGAGADPAWMVRFLMAMFGWFAVLVSGDF